MVKYVEELNTELDSEGVRYTRNLRVFDHGNVDVEQPWPDDGISPQRAQQVDACRISEFRIAAERWRRTVERQAQGYDARDTGS